MHNLDKKHEPSLNSESMTQIESKEKTSIQSAKIEFEDVVVLEHSYLGVAKVFGSSHNTMELVRNAYKYIQIVWNIEFIDTPTPPRKIEILLIVGEDGKTILDYNGVFGLPKKAIALLNQNGYITSEIQNYEKTNY